MACPGLIERFQESGDNTVGYARAEKLLASDATLSESLAKANLAGSDVVVSLIRDNRWLGSDLQLWLLHRGLNGAGEYKIVVAGHGETGACFSAWLDDRILLEGGGDEGNIQKVAVTGSQDRYAEVHSALAQGKRITSSSIYIEIDENTWKFTLDGENFFFKSLKCPSVRIEKDTTVEEMSEREAVFYERVFLIEKGLQLFESLYLLFLQERLSSDWSSKIDSINSWQASLEASREE